MQIYANIYITSLINEQPLSVQDSFKQIFKYTENVSTHRARLNALYDSTCVPNTRYPNWANDMKTMINIIVNASRSLAHDDIVADSCVIVLLKLINLNSCAEHSTNEFRSQMQPR